MIRVFFIVVFVITNLCVFGQLDDNKLDTINIYFENGSIKETGHSYDGNLYGKWSYYYKSGSLKEEGEYEILNIEDTVINTCIKSFQFTKIDKWKTYYESGELKSLGFYSDNISCKIDTINAIDPTYGSYSIIQLVPVYSKNKIWKYYSENGSIIKLEKWRKGKLKSVKYKSKS